MLKKIIPFYLLFNLIFFQDTLKAQLISYEVIDTFSKDELKQHWKDSKVPQLMLPIKNDVVLYDMLYYTNWVDGSRIPVSGLYFAPITKKSFPVVVYNHGTRIRKGRSNKIRGENLISMLFAADGYGVIMPDYIGLGKSDKTHLYCHADSEADAGIDFLKIIEGFNSKNNLKWNKELFITGYSQGGHSTLALHRKLQNEYPDKFPVTASSPMSGPYDLAVTQAEVMYKEYSQPHYLPYLIIGANTAYNIWPDEKLYSIFQPPYDTIIPDLFDGNHTYADINSALPIIPKDMLRPEMNLEYETNPDYFFRKIMIENSVDDWKPESPVQFCFCKGDEEVKWENAVVAHDKMKAKGAEYIYLLNVGDEYNHRQCADYACVYSKFFFDSFKKGSKKGRRGPIHKRFLLSLAKAIR
jgi:hypothetical protein